MPIWEVIVRLWYFGVKKYGDALKRAKQATLEGSQKSVVLRTMEDKLTRLERETRMLIETAGSHPVTLERVWIHSALALWQNFSEMG